MRRWIMCNVFGVHVWGDCGYTDIYSVRQWHCGHCGRVKDKGGVLYKSNPHDKIKEDNNG